MSQTRKPTTSPSRRQLLQQSLGGAVVLWLGPQQLAWGADLVAVVSGIYAASDPVATQRAYLAQFA